MNTPVLKPMQSKPVFSANDQRSKKAKQLAYAQYELALTLNQDYKAASQALSQAKKHIQQALSFSPTDTDSLNLLSRIELESGQPDSAFKAINAAIELDPENGGYWYSAGHILLADHQTAKAKIAFENAIEFSPNETSAETGLAYALMELDQPVKAFQIYRELIKNNPEDIQLRSLLLQSAKTLKADYYDHQLENDLIGYLKWENTNLADLANLCCSMLEHKFQLNDDGSASLFEEMAESELLQLALCNTIIKSASIEKLIMALRYELLTHSTKNGNLSHKYMALNKAIAYYGLKSEFVLPVTDSEKNMVDTLINIIDLSLEKVGCMPTDISGALLLLAMYEPWSVLKNYSKLSSFSNDSWPSMTYDLKLKNHAIFTVGSMDIDAITAIPKDNSNNVKQQYESFPYPRWDKLDHKKPTHYGVALSKVYPEAMFSRALFENKLNILIAGCGTGRHALNVAKNFNNVNVTAIDLSQKSLSYAKVKSQEFNIKNIAFNQADLTKLNVMEKPYDIIECSGVLHHIPDYKPALNNILQNLKPNGLIKISLYSQYAREPINHIRGIFAQDIKDMDIHKLKIIRQAIATGSIIEDNSGIISSDDFYSMSGVIDLLFHQFERQFTPIDLKELCDEFNLEWLGFSNLKDSIKSKFLDFHKADGANLLDLSQWDAFEQANPTTFCEMYQFYCQYKPKLKAFNK